MLSVASSPLLLTTMTADNSTVPEFRAIGVNTLALTIIRDFAVGQTARMVELFLSSLVFGSCPYETSALQPHFSAPILVLGALTTLTLTAIYFLM